jgi:hypothetical protein
VTSKLSRHRRHSFLPLRERDQQLGLLFGPFARFCRFHCCLAPRIETCINCDRDSGAMMARRAVRSGLGGLSAQSVASLI